MIRRTTHKEQPVKLAVFYLVAIFGPFLLLEAFFRLLPVNYPPHLLPVSERNPVVRFQPNIDFGYSKGWDFAIRTRKHSNNVGYMSPVDYHGDESTPLIAVIGDSYVEAMQVDAGRSAVDLLHKQIEGRGRVYGIGMSGASLSQYLVFADFARSTFHPEAMAFVIISNDFDESLLKYKAEPRFHYFEESGDNFVLTRVDYRLSKTKEMLRHSALVRYVMLNLSVKENLERLLAKRTGVKQDYVGNVPAEVESLRRADSMHAVDEFFRRVRTSTGLDPQSVLFVLDGLRRALYSPAELSKAENSYAAVMMRYFKEQAVANGYEVLDMQPVFVRHYGLNGRRFEFDTDGHWNELGHQLVAEEIQKSRVFNNVFGVSKPEVTTREPATTPRTHLDH